MCGRTGGGRRAPGYDQGEGRRRRRAPDLGTVRAEIEADAPRVRCPAHGAVAAQAPRARHGAWHTRAFEDTAAWPACGTSKPTITELMRVSWRAVGSMTGRVSAEKPAGTGQMAGLQQTGIGEIAYRKGFKYLVVVVDHDSRPLIWAAPGRDKATVLKFFDAPGEEHSAQLTQLSADGASRIARGGHRAGTEPFHVVSWAAEALDEVRREVRNHARAGPPASGRIREYGRAAGDARNLKNTRYALRKNPENLTANQAAQMDWISKTRPCLHRARLLKERLRVIFKLKGHPRLTARAPAAGSPGPPGPASPSSPSSAARSATTGPASKPPCATPCPTG